MDALFEYALSSVGDEDMVGLAVHKEGTEN
jgi:hypothetical protein